MQFVSVRILPLYLLVFFIFLVCLNGANADDNVTITSIKYSNDFENGEAVNIVPSGKNESTDYSFRIFDDNDDFPGFLSSEAEEVSFVISEWWQDSKIPIWYFMYGCSTISSGPFSGPKSFSYRERTRWVRIM